MGSPNLSNEIQNQIDNTIQRLPVNKQCSILKTYENNFADIQLTDTNDVLNYVEVIGENKTGVNGLLVFINGDLNNPVVITGGVNGESGGDVNYVKKEDVKLKFDLESNGYITIGIDVGDGF